MKFVKILVPILAILLIVPALLPGQFEVTRSIEIETAQSEVYSYLVNLEAWQEWSPWLEKEPSAQFSFNGIPGVVGSYTEWDGEEIGAGRQTLTKLEEPSYIETQLEFKSPDQSTNTGFMKIEDRGDSKTQIIWGIKGKLDYPIGRIFGLFLPSMIQADFDKGLSNLKKRLEQN